MAIPLPRRKFLSLFSSAAIISLPSNQLLSDDTGRPAVQRPRSTDGDERFEPDWEQQFTLTVGNHGADINGKSDRALQAAVDYVKRMGGGTVQIMPGEFTLRNSVFLPSRIRIKGSGADTLITKGPSVSTNISEDSDWYDQEITLEDAKSFQVGDAVFIQVHNPNHNGLDTIKRTLVARNGKRFKLNDGLRKNVWLKGKPTATSVFPLFTSERTSDVIIQDLVLDGNRENNVNMNGNYGGCIFLQDCNRYTMNGVTTRNYNGDGISFQICHDVVVENCYSHGNQDLGVHPGSGSQRPVIRNNKLHDNGIGIFWCWGVRYGLAERNNIQRNRNFGISIGHCDTDNVMRFNTVVDSGKVGILFRDDSRGKDFWANRNIIEENKIINSGAADGIGILIEGRTRDTQVRNNSIIEKRGPMNRTAIKIQENVGNLNLESNTIEGYNNKIVDDRK
ncbi:MAG: right-handed parallel beta-helix repeat-containing protein [Planctomycetaceae bacterium]|jgi:hypothetical protein|nr:right-handed parallel beta-helix repeat-containing protein [Planctomycetaceae bacterium]MBT6846714.1 right-handed parallel beta-helix repeat-containing protein [Planctomycetaceae bacterium]